MDIEHLAHNETREIDLWNKIITKADVQKLAKDIYAISEKEEWVSYADAILEEKNDNEEVEKVVAHRVFFRASSDEGSISTREEPLL
jgi:hypothetical protein